MGKGKTGAIRQTTLDRATLNAMESAREAVGQHGTGSPRP